MKDGPWQPVRQHVWNECRPPAPRDHAQSRGMCALIRAVQEVGDSETLREKREDKWLQVPVDFGSPAKCVAVAAVTVMLSKKMHCQIFLFSSQQAVVRVLLSNVPKLLHAFLKILQAGNAPWPRERRR